ncbi:MAG: hypothetical protein L6Q47_05800 [Ignavibacteriaceae bacterium]|nr:hypothetical protein [Ignavibacteriaceae bacterium]
MDTIFFIISSSIHTLAQSVFNSNDDYDFTGLHYLTAGGTNPDNFNLFIESNSDFRRFKLDIAKNRLHLGSTWFAWQYRVDMNNDGTWEQVWTTANEITVSYTYPNPPNGISANNTIKIEIQYQENPCCGTVSKTKFIPITIFSTPRVYVNNENDSFIQLRDEDATAKIPVLMVEGFDPLNENYPELYYNLTWELINQDLYPNGYAVFILNFKDGGADLRSNANVLLGAIEKIHQICPNYQIAVAGLSMGGTITRYALAKKESLNEFHNVGLFISFDSPQGGAHINPDMQDWIKVQNPNQGVIGLLQDNLGSVAAKQILRYNTYDPTHVFQEEFNNELNALNGNGYPHQSYNVSVSNGNLNATWGYESVGRHLLTLKINDNLIKDVPAVQMDCGTGSMLTDITMKRYGDIFSNPFIRIYYELQIIFNPAFIPTWSGLDLVGTNIDPITGDITSFNRSKFDDYVVQTVPLRHHELSMITRNKIMNWLDKDLNIAINYNLLEGGSASSDNYQVNILHGIPITVQPKNINVNGKQIIFDFTKWDDGSTYNPRIVFPSYDVSFTATMKGVHISSQEQAFSGSSQRKLIRTQDFNNPLHIVYESMGKVWYEMSTNNGATWEIMNNGQPLSSNESKNPSIDFYSGCTAVVFEEKVGSSGS